MSENGEMPDAIKLLKDIGIRKIKPEHNVFALYQSCAELMAKDGRIGEAVKLLKDEGIPKLKPEHSVQSLYQSCAELMAKDGRISEAIEILKQGIQRMPPNRFNRYILVDMMRDCCVATNDLASFLWAQSEAQKETFGQKQHWQWKITASVLAKDWKSALSLTHQAKAAFPGYLNFYIHEAYCLLHLADAQAAFDAIQAFPKQIYEKESVPNFWLLALICFRRGDAESARSNLATFLACPQESCPDLTEESFKRLWKTSCGSELYKSPAFFFPFFPPVAAVTTPAQAQVVSSAGRTVLAVATEWHSAHGGVSTFNRELCRAFAKEGSQVWCYVPDAKPEEIAQVKEDDGVSLISAPQEAQANQDARLRNRPALPAGTEPDFIISHDRITGPAATSLVENHFPKSKHVLFIHTAPKQIEWFKEQGDETTATSTGELRRQLQISLARKAYLVASVGPKLQNAMANELHALTPSKTALEFLPGLETPFRDASPPPANECLVLGRAEDADLKGLDIAARAMAKLVAAHPQTITPTPVLVIRGSPIGTGDELRNDLMQKSHLGANHLHIREYSSDVDVIRRDMLSSALVLMPSRTEGFGLAALEAIALGIPVLVSDQSGLAETLNALVPEHARKCVVHVSADIETDATAWERKIDFVLSDKPAAFARANELRLALAPHLSWQKAVRSLVEAIAAKSV
jgi:glycosyltransferase involved in cell wall biosynthesis